MEIVFLCMAAFGASLLTFYSGFGLGTILSPVFMFYFEVEIAIAMTAIVHLANNLFKFSLSFRSIDFQVLWKFGLPAVIAAWIGSKCLLNLSNAMNSAALYSIFGNVFETNWIRLVLAFVLICFALLEMIPYFQNLQFSSRLIPLGGLFSGFFGGLTGMQGALRSAFLIRANLSKDAFVATTVAASLCIDLSRLINYSERFGHIEFYAHWHYLLLPVLAAILGAWIGFRFLLKVTIYFMQKTVAIGLIVFAGCLILGVI